MENPLINALEPDSDTSNESGSAAEESIRTYSVVLPEVGQKIGHLRIIDLIAEGGMATVYKVWHEDLEIVRAIKILKPGFDEESKKRLRTEAKISAHLRHPNIVDIYGLHFLNHSVPYIEMEFVDGYSLKQLIEKRKQLPYAFSLALMYFICNALHYAHNQVFTLYGKTYEGIIHRDIKPANILLTRNGIPKLADFGIAKPQDISLHTEGQKVMGTFTYLSPEQLNGDPLDRRSDIYSLGTVLYESLTGEKVFPQRSLTDLIRQKMMNNYLSFNSLNIEVPKKCEQLIEKSIAINPEKRFETAKEFGRELIDLLKKSSDEPAEQILVSYCSGYDGVSAAKIKKHRLALPVVVFSASILTVALVFLFLLMSGFKTKKMSPQSDMRSSTQQDVPKVHAQKPVPVPAKQPEPSSAEAPAPRLPHEQAPESKTAAPVKPIPADRLAEAYAAVKSQRWAEAIPLLETSISLPIPDSTRQQAQVFLLESYLAVNDLPNAKMIASQSSFSDGYFFLLSGKTFVKLGMFPQAANAFLKAQTTPSRMTKDVRKDATYLWAKTIGEAYKVKPNSENKRASVKAWQQFKSAFCEGKDGTALCAEAEKEIKNLSE
jgi:serine/threonine protein kinase